MKEEDSDVTMLRNIVQEERIAKRKSVSTGKQNSPTFIIVRLNWLKVVGRAVRRGELSFLSNGADVFDSKGNSISVFSMPLV